MSSFKEELERSGYLVYTNKGDSMMPLLREGRDLLVIRKKQAPPQVGDAVLHLRDNGQYILHRIIKAYENGTYRIAGDNRAVEEIVREDQIIGVLTEIRRDGTVLSVTDPAYLRYVRRVPRHRRWLKLRALPRKILYRIYRLFFKKRRNP